MSKKRKKKKILFVISTLTGGGAERTLCNITCGLPDDVMADILINYETEQDYPHKGNVISLGMPKRKKFSLGYQFVTVIRRYIRLRQLKAQGGYDACISFMDSANIANVLSGKKHCKVILSERINLSSCTSAGYRYIVGPLAKLLYPRANYMVSLSKGVEADLIENYNLPKKCAVTIYNGYSIDTIQKKAQEPSAIEIEKDKFYFISVGRLCEQKGQWHLIKAFREVVKKHPQSRLIICGKGPYLPMLEQMAQKYGLSDYVIFAGFQKNPYAIAAKCNVFVFPSNYEGFGSAMIENMACGLPVISTDYRSGAREILAPDTDFRMQQLETIERAEYGILVPVCKSSIEMSGEENEPEENLLANAMNILIEEEQTYNQYKELSLKRAKEFSIERTVEKWLSL
ncbi:MAG: glycosyltransferase [Lachnospiraceae bacterium]|nr:glycosyltransferase [Lachnospiraceae bacterium]